MLYGLLQHRDVGYSPADVISQEETMNISGTKSRKHFCVFRQEVGKGKPVGLIQPYNSFMPAHDMS